MKTKNAEKNKKWYSTSNIIYGVIIVLLITLIASPDAKSLMIRGLMKIGLFQPDIPAQKAKVTSDESIKQAVAEAPYDFIVEAGSGEKISLASLKGKVVFINFWATWCPPCRAEMPTINTLYNKLKEEEDVVFLMVDMEESYAKAKKFMEDMKLDLPVHMMASQIPSGFFSGALPTTVILDEQGNIALRHEGATDFSNPKVEEFIRTLMVKDK